MKRLLVIMLAVVAMAACKKEEAKPWLTIDPYLMVQIKPMENLTKSGNPEHLSALEIVKQTTHYTCSNDNEYEGWIDCYPSVWSKELRDTLSDPPMLLRQANDVIYLVEKDVWGLQRGWVDAYDLVLGRGTSYKDMDTIAYIPNATMRAARDVIDAAWEAQDEATIYEAFKNAFTFVPITGAEYKELKRQGLQ